MVHLEAAPSDTALTHGGIRGAEKETPNIEMRTGEVVGGISAAPVVADTRTVGGSVLRSPHSPVRGDPSLRAVLVDVAASVGTCSLGLVDADEACLAAWVAKGSVSGSAGVRHHQESEGRRDTADIEERGDRESGDGDVSSGEQFGVPWTSLSERVRGECLSALRDYRYSYSTPADGLDLDESVSNGDSDEISAKSRTDSDARTDAGGGGDITDGVGRPVLQLYLHPVSALCDRLLVVLGAGEKRVTFSSYCSACCVHCMSSGSSCGCARGNRIAAQIALEEALAAYGTSCVPSSVPGGEWESQLRTSIQVT